MNLILPNTNTGWADVKSKSSNETSNSEILNHSKSDVNMLILYLSYRTLKCMYVNHPPPQSTVFYTAIMAVILVRISKSKIKQVTASWLTYKFVSRIYKQVMCVLLPVGQQDIVYKYVSVAEIITDYNYCKKGRDFVRNKRAQECRSFN